MTQTEVRTSFQYLRSVCPHLPHRLALGRAVANGWDAAALTKLAEQLIQGSYGHKCSPKEFAYWCAIEIGTERIYEADKRHWSMKKAPMPEDTDNLPHIKQKERARA